MKVLQCNLATGPKNSIGKPDGDCT